MAGNNVLVYGGAGALGKVIVQHFKQQSWNVLSVDVNSNSDANTSIQVSASSPWIQGSGDVAAKVAQALKDTKVQAIVCVAGGWAGGNAASADLLSSVDKMWAQSVQSSVTAAQLAAKHLDKNGLLVLTGAAAALSGTPGMIGYGIAKAAVHQLVKSLAAEGSGMPSGARTAAILPVTLDTPANRAGMPGADTSSWTPMDAIAKKVFEWSGNSSAVTNGALYTIVTKDNNTTFEAAKAGLL
ncbi:hypothetical protein RI367_000224 [Sorochytrium milnesiophthora]